MNVNLNAKSAAFWSTLAGAAGVVCGALGLGSISTPVEALIVAVGGVLIAVPAHHVIAKQQGTTSVVVKSNNGGVS